MHGRNRAAYKAAQRDAAVQERLATKAQQWQTATRQLSLALEELAREPEPKGSTMPKEDRKSASQTTQLSVEDALALTEKLLTVNPDPLYLWNQRRALLALQSASSDSSSPFQLPPELALTQAALQSGNPKAYGAWHHRQWSLRQWLLGDQEEASQHPEVLPNELQLTEQFLQVDERNFHCWNYRRYVVACRLGLAATGQVLVSDIIADAKDDIWFGAQLAPPVASATTSLKPESLSIAENNLILQDEWDFCTRKIHDNFSNGSAFDYRSKLLPWKLSQVDNPWSLLQSELQLANNAMFTEPDDQTAWWYHGFLLDTARDLVLGESTTQESVFQEMLQEQRQLLEELAADEESSKWVWLGLLGVLERLDGEATNQQRRDILERLLQLDPDRTARYQYLLKQV